jgi:glycosyltransferase involved in cell wall biosynthesis
LRALYVNHTSRVSGGELSLLTLLGGLPEQVEPVVACPEGDLAERLRALGIEVIPIRGTDGSLRLHPARTPRALAEMGHATLQLRRAAGRTNADLVHANSIRAGLIATGAGIAGGPPTVVHVRDCLPEGRVSALTLRAIGRADAVIANSSYTRSTLGPAKASATVVHNAVDLSRFEPEGLTKAEAQARLGLEGAGPVLAVVAQITPWKGQDDAIRIAGELLARHPDLQLLLVGSAKFDSAATRYDNKAFLESLHRQVDELDLAGAVRFLGQREDIPEILRGVDLLLVPSWEEPFGRAIVEAMAAGVPVLATEVGGPPEILDAEGGEQCGLVLPPRRPDLWAEATEGLLADRGRLAAMADAGRRTARRSFGLDRHVSAVLGVYESVVGGVAATG